VLLDTGNVFDTPTESGDVRTHTLLETMQKLGYKAVGVGERDLQLGYDEFMRKIAGIDIPFVSTNIVKQGTAEPAFTPYTIVEAKGQDGKPIRIGVLGVIRYNPVWQKAGPAGTNLATVPPEQMLKTYLPEVRAKSDVVVLLASLAKDDAHALAREFPDLDLVLASYGGIYNAVEEQEGRVHIYYSGNQGKRIGETRLALDAGHHLTGLVTYMHFLNAKYPEQKAMAEFVASVLAKIAPTPAAAAPAAAPAAVAPHGR
jgi:2',3'-cyclic-nucleotide 2'-phosphodiesterase (5'-nucleotidase family)